MLLGFCLFLIPLIRAQKDFFLAPPSGGLNKAGRASYKRETGGTLKAPTKSKTSGRRKSFCARMSGMKKRLTSAKTARDPDSRINKALRKWDC